MNKFQMKSREGGVSGNILMIILILRVIGNLKEIKS